MSESLYAGLTSQSIDLFIQDSSSTTGAGLAGLVYNSAGLVASYRKGATGSRTAITLATQTVGGAYSSGGFVEIDATNMKGVYRLDIPNAAIDTEGYVTLYLYGATNMLATALRIDCRPLPADVKKWLGTAASTPTTAGVPNVNVKTWNDLTTVALPLVPTTAGRTLDVSAGGEAGVDWGNVGSPTTVVGLSGTTVGTITTYTGNTVQTGDAFGRIGSNGAGLTALGDPRLAYLDASISSLTNLSALVNLYGSPLLEIPDSGSTLFAYTLVVRDNEGKLVTLDASPTITAANAAGTDRSANLSAVSNPATGRYTFTYSVASTAAAESLRITCSGTVSAEGRYVEWIGAVVDYDSLTTLAAIQAKTDLIPASPAAVGSAMTLATDAVNAAALAASAVSEIQSGLATSIALATAQTSIDDLPTNGELATALASSDDATLAAIAGLSIPTTAQINTAVEGGAVGTNVTTLLSRLTSSRAGYLDYLNIGGNAASQADITALNQSASRRVVLTTVQQYERPESGSVEYTVETRTYDGDGAATAADTTPTLTATGSVSGNLAANVATATNPATGVYRWQYTVSSSATLEQIRFDVSATMGTAFTLSAYTQVCDVVSSNWTTADRTKLEAVYNKLPSRAYLVGTAASTGAFVTADVGLASANLDTQFGLVATGSALTTLSSKVGTPAGASVSADIAAVKVDTLVAKYGSVVILGTIDNAGTAAEEYTYGGITVTYAGLDSSGNRTGVTIT